MFLKKNCNIINRNDRLRNQQINLFYYSRYMNKKIVEKGTKKQKEQAWKNLILTEQLRGRRSVTGFMSSMFSVSNKLNRTIFDAENTENLPGTLLDVKVEKQKAAKRYRSI